VRSGYIDISISKSKIIGQWGYNWSSTTGINSDGVYILSFSGIVRTENSGYRYYAFPLRCLAS